jgi:hypothetical protein
MLFPLPCADDERVVGLHGNHPPEFLDGVGVSVAMRCGMNVPGMWTGMERILVLQVNHNITGLKSTSHSAPLGLAILS